MHYFFENNLLCSWVFNKQIKHIVIMSKSLWILWPQGQGFWC
jgi:hypothetical protein